MRGRSERYIYRALHGGDVDVAQLGIRTACSLREVQHAVVHRNRRRALDEGRGIGWDATEQRDTFGRDLVGAVCSGGIAGHEMHGIRSIRQSESPRPHRRCAAVLHVVERVIALIG